MRTHMSVLTMAALLLTVPAAGARPQPSLEQLEPETRMIELCDIAVSDRIARETDYSRIDRLVASAVSDAQAAADKVLAEGAAFRNQGHWYGLRYACRLNPEHDAVEALRYAIGHEIPETSWEQYGLWR